MYPSSRRGACLLRKADGQRRHRRVGRLVATGDMKVIVSAIWCVLEFGDVTHFGHA